VLVAEDDAAIRDVVAEALSDEGYAVTAVANGQEALEALFQLDLTQRGHSVNVVHSAEHALKA
jgi:CheY-like chemotaxis protein